MSISGVKKEELRTLHVTENLEGGIGLFYRWVPLKKGERLWTINRSLWHRGTPPVRKDVIVGTARPELCAVSWSHRV